MKTAQNVPRTGLARVKGEHLTAANDAPKPAQMQGLLQGARYVRAADTDVRRTWSRFGWSPALKGVR
jgi:hypothetical protein